MKVIGHVIVSLTIGGILLGITRSINGFIWFVHHKEKIFK